MGILLLPLPTQRPPANARQRFSPSSKLETHASAQNLARPTPQETQSQHPSEPGSKFHAHWMASPWLGCSDHRGPKRKSHVVADGRECADEYCGGTVLGIRQERRPRRVRYWGLYASRFECRGLCLLHLLSGSTLLTLTPSTMARARSKQEVSIPGRCRYYTNGTKALGLVGLTGVYWAAV